MNANAPIGIFDSGVGGYTVARALQKALPKENVIYYGDGHNAPYGNRSKEDIVHLVRQILDFMASKQVKAVGIACNTISTLIDEFTGYDFPIFSIVQAGADEVVRCAPKQVAVLSTCFTAQTGAYAKLINAAAPRIEVLSQGSVNLAALVESGTASDGEIAAELHDSLGKLTAVHPKVDTLVLGCTHYPLARDIIAKEFPQFTNIIDPAMGQVEQLRSCLAANNALNHEGGSLKVFTSGDCAKYEALAARLGMVLDGPATQLHVATPL